MVSPRIDTTVGKPQTKARVIEARILFKRSHIVQVQVQQSPEAVKFQVLSNAGLASVWKSSNILTEIKMVSKASFIEQIFLCFQMFRPMFSNWIPQCNGNGN